jgi:hypothetical protein
MALATPVTNKFHIGSPEIRLGPMTKANKLTQANSVGLLQQANVKFNQTSVDLKAGLPKTIVDTAVTETEVTVDAQAYEYSRKNIRIMINEGAEVLTPIEFNGLVTTAVVAATTGNTDIETDILLTDVAVGDLVVVYNPAAPQNLSVVKVTAKAVVATDKAKITIDNTKTPLLFDASVGDVVYKANQIGLGNSTATNYFSCDVLGQEHSTGRPVGFRFWKAALGGGLDYSFSSDNFAVTPLTIKIMQPSAAEYAVGGPLAHLAEIIPIHPFGFYFAG